ncbi:MAG: VCBS repeat-containing protein [Bacteroidia bacterium]|nr:VCBS repeat-containing protein [Bacteroidia bacterium]
MKKKFLLYKDFAGKSIEEVVGSDMIKKSLHLKVETLASSVLLNDGNNQFRLVALPVMAQLSPVFTILIEDFDKDGAKDIFTGGNFLILNPT